MAQKFKPGDRVRLICNFPDDAIPLLEGDLGMVEANPSLSSQLGFRKQGSESISFSRKLAGQIVHVLDYCELVDAKQKFKVGDRVRLTRDLAHERPALLKGWEGLVVQGSLAQLLGVRFDYRNGVTYLKTDLEGKRISILDFCELVEPAAANEDGVEISSILQTAKKLICYHCNAENAVDPETWECEICGANFADIAPDDDLDMEAEDCHICGSEADNTIAVCKECKQDLIAPMPEVDYKGIEASLAALRPMRWEIKTIIQDLDDSSADNSLSQALNDGWEILEISHHVVGTTDGEFISPLYRRVVTLRRAVDAREWVKKESEKLQPQLQTLSSAIGLFKDFLETDGDNER